MSARSTRAAGLVLALQGLLAQASTGDAQIPSDCISWFDGCNRCSVQDGQVQACTEMACSTYRTPRCMLFQEEHKEPKPLLKPALLPHADSDAAADRPSSIPSQEQLAECDRWYDGCNTCTVVHDEHNGAALGACTALMCLRTAGTPRCVKKSDKHVVQLSRDDEMMGCKLWFDGCNTCSVENGELLYCTLMACLPPMGKAHCKVREDDVEKVAHSIYEGCATWFDGCNTCSVSDGKLAGCTRMMCHKYQEPRCMHQATAATHSPYEGCVSWYDGCNTCRVKDGQLAGCTKRMCFRFDTPKCLKSVDGETTSGGVMSTAEDSIEEKQALKLGDICYQFCENSADGEKINKREACPAESPCRAVPRSEGHSIGFDSCGEKAHRCGGVMPVRSFENSENVSTPQRAVASLGEICLRFCEDGSQAPIHKDCPVEYPCSSSFKGATFDTCGQFAHTCGGLPVPEDKSRGTVGGALTEVIQPTVVNSMETHWSSLVSTKSFLETGLLAILLMSTSVGACWAMRPRKQDPQADIELVNVCPNP